MTKAFGLSFGPPLIIFLFLCWLKNTNPINLTLTILSHFSASQSYGYKAISLEYDMTFFAHYIIFPILVLLFAGYLFFRIFQNKNKENDTDALNSYLLLYCCFFYILNFHRGLVRHSFVEESDLHLSTFFFLIFPSGILILCKPYLKKEYLQIAFVLISIILLYNYKNPKSEVLNSVSVLDQFTQRLNSYQPISSTEIEINRGTNKQKNQYKNILHFFKTNLSKNQTFFDFTNSPMLYFYARKENPVYFNQSPNMIHNDFLQEMTLKSLSKQDIPFVLYRHIPEHGHDAFEEIPNAVRHYLLSHHIFEKYEPYLIIDGFAVWKSKDLVTEDLILDKHYKVDQISGQPIMQDIGMIPYVWAKFDIEKLLPIIEKSKDTDILDANIGHSATFQFGSSNNKKLGNSVLVKITSQKDETHDIKLTYGKGEKIHGRFMFKTYNDHLGHYYLIRMSTQYNWLNKNNNYVEVQPLSGNVKIQFIGIL